MSPRLSLCQPAQCLLSRLLGHLVPSRSPCHMLGSGHTESSPRGRSTPAGSLPLHTTVSWLHPYVVLDSVPLMRPSAPDSPGCGWCNPTLILHLLKCLQGEGGPGGARVPATPGEGSFPRLNPESSSAWDCHSFLLSPSKSETLRRAKSRRASWQSYWSCMDVQRGFCVPSMWVGWWSSGVIGQSAQGRALSSETREGPGEAGSVFAAPSGRGSAGPASCPACPGPEQWAMKLPWGTRSCASRCCVSVPPSRRPGAGRS